MSFKLGNVVVTRNCLSFAEENGVDLITLLARHINRDWGDVCADDWAANDEALKEGTRLLSSYQLKEGRIWIITEADRSSTTFLLPEDY